MTKQKQKYDMIPVDRETFIKFKQICAAYERKQGAQVKVMVEREWNQLSAVKLLPEAEPETSTQTNA